jgi:hypothetical protein
MRRLHRRSSIAAFIALAFLILAAPAALAAAAESPGLSIEDAWLRATPPGATVGAGFLQIVNKTQAADRLLAVEAPATAAKVELHQTIMTGTVAEMRPVTGGLVIPPGGRVTFQPGGTHLMFFGLKSRLSEGEHVKVRLIFEKAGKLEVDFAVRGVGAGAPQTMQMQ